MNETVEQFVASCALPVKHNLLVFVNGRFFNSLSSFDRQIAQVLDNNLLMEAGGVALSILDNTIIVNPVHLLFVSTKSHANKISNVVTVGVASKIILLEEFVGFADDAYSNHICTSLTLKQGASAEFYKVQKEGVFSSHFADLSIYQSCSSKLMTTHLGLGSVNACENINVFLEGEGANCNLSGLYLPCGKQNLEYHLLVEHKAANCSSRELFKGVVDDFARSTFDGKVIMREGAIKNFAKLNNRNLLLSDSAQAIAKPALEIYVDDVQCTHGATVGQLDSSALWYLRSRGIPEAEARQMLIDGFVREITANLPEFLRAKAAKNKDIC